MKRIKNILLSVLVLLSTAYAANMYSDWKIDQSNYVIKFNTKKAKGTIQGLKGTINFDQNNLSESNIQVQVDVNTLDMGMGLKTKHAKADDFFHVSAYPTISFTSSKFSKSASGYVVEGDLKIKDVTKKVSIPFTFTENQNKAEFIGAFEVNRLDYNLIKKGVGEVVNIEIKLPVSK